MLSMCYNSRALEIRTGYIILTALATQEATSVVKSSKQIQRLAWVIMFVSLAMFCSVSIAISGGIYYFLFRSTLPMDVVVEVSRGSAGFSAIDYEQNVTTNDLPLPMSDRPSSLSTDNLSQAAITFSIPAQADSELTTSVLGTITLKNNSFITLQNARRPRFSWNNGAYALDFTNFRGEADIYLTSPEIIPVELQIRTGRGNATFLFDTNGRYTIFANDTQIQVVTFEGRALLISPNNNNSRLTVAGEQATLLTGSNLPTVATAPTNLIENGLFAFDFTQTETGERFVPRRWACFSPFDAPPSGEWYIDTWEGRNAIRLIRETGDASSRTGCNQTLNIPVAQYTYLELQATISLNLQSLVNCGDLGSECPMMIFIDYLDINGVDRTWYQGIFSNFDPQSSAPLVCQTCGQIYEHRPISEQVWYTFESGNLFTRLSEDTRPIEIIDVEFYASGHRYDVFISEIALLAGTPVTPPDFPESQGD